MIVAKRFEALEIGLAFESQTAKSFVLLSSRATTVRFENPRITSRKLERGETFDSATNNKHRLLEGQTFRYPFQSRQIESKGMPV
jgi:hypothetical protein